MDFAEQWKCRSLIFPPSSWNGLTLVGFLSCPVTGVLAGACTASSGQQSSGHESRLTLESPRFGIWTRFYQLEQAAHRFCLWFWSCFGFFLLFLLPVVLCSMQISLLKGKNTSHLVKGGRMLSAIFCTGCWASWVSPFSCSWQTPTETLAKIFVSSQLTSLSFYRASEFSLLLICQSLQIWKHDPDGNVCNLHGSTNAQRILIAFWKLQVFRIKLAWWTFSCLFYIGSTKASCMSTCSISLTHPAKGMDSDLWISWIFVIKKVIIKWSLLQPARMRWTKEGAAKRGKRVTG